MDVAALALNVESSSVVKATDDLNKFAASADKAAASAGKLSGTGSTAKLGQDYARASQAADKASGSIMRIADSVVRSNAAMSAAASASSAMRAANDNTARSFQQADAHVQAYTKHVQSMGAALQQADAHVLAYRNQIKGVGAVADKTTTAIKFTAREGLNASRQLADIGTTALLGMNPFLIAVQQGPQLFDILQEKAVATGSTIGATFRAAAVSLAGFLAPLLPIIAAIGVLVAGLAALTAQANDDSGLKKYTTAMGYTKAEVEKLNAVTVTMGDTAKAVFQVGWSRIADAFGISTDEIAKKWKGFLDWLATATRATLAGIYAAILGTMDLIDNVAKDAVSGDLGVETLTKGYKDRYAQAQRFFDDVSKQAGANARARQDAMAKKFYDAPKGSKSDPLGDILRAAEAEIKAEQARAAAAGLSARAAAELEQKTKLLNQIEKAKIPVTDALREKVKGLAKAYAEAKIAADIAVAVQGVTDGLQKQNDAINDQLVLVGMYGDELTAARIEMEALAKARDALPKGEQLSPEQARKILDATKPVIRDQQNLDLSNRLEKTRKDAEDAAYAMDLERAGLELTGRAALEYTYIVDQLNKAKQEGTKLTAEEISAIYAAADAYAAQRYALDQQAKTIADTREVARGFFSDTISGLRASGNAFKAFADAAVNALNRVIDKLLDRALNGFLDSLFPSSGAKVQAASLATIAANPAIFANGGAFGTAQKFANGGTFTNQVITQPTLFKFANGSKFGEMGEAGPEAVMPLTRGPDGKLGVQSTGGGGKNVIRMGDYNPTYSFDGAVGIDSIVALIRQGGAETYNQMKRDLQSLLQQLDIDGTVVT